MVRDAAQLVWIVNLGCIDLNPHPVRADDLDHPDELRVDLDPVPGIEWPQIRDVAMVTKEVLEDFGLLGWPKTSGSRGMHVYARVERRWSFPEVRRAALAVAREVERRAPDLATSRWWKEERHGVFLDYNQNAKDRTVASQYSVRPTPDARVSTPLRWDEVPGCDPDAFTIDTVPARFADIGDPADGIDDAAGSLEPLLELAAQHEAAGFGDAPWPPQYAKQEGEPARVQPSKRRRGTPQKEGVVPPPAPGKRTGPTGRRRTKAPLIEIARAETEAEAMQGFERWKSRHPEVAAALQPADVMVDPMRGRSTAWYRIRVNLRNVPEDERPPRRPSRSTTTRGKAWTSRRGAVRSRSAASGASQDEGEAPAGGRRPRCHSNSLDASVVDVLVQTLIETRIVDRDVYDGALMSFGSYTHPSWKTSNSSSSSASSVSRGSSPGTRSRESVHATFTAPGTDET